MSKTIGNVRRPDEMTDLFGPDGFRYLMLREVPFDRDGDFTLDVFINRYNADLANDLGNLLSRTLKMVTRFLGGAVPAVPGVPENDGDRDLDGLLETVPGTNRAFMEEFEFHKGLAEVWRLVTRSNRYIEENRPWDLTKDETRRERLESVLGRLLRVLRAVSVLAWPAMPERTAEMRRQLGLPGEIFSNGTVDLERELGSGTEGWDRVGQAAQLFPRLAVPESDS